MAQIAPLTFTATLVALETLLNHPPDVTDTLVQRLLYLLESEHYTTVSGLVLDRLLTSYPHKLTNRLLVALASPGLHSLNLPSDTRVTGLGLRQVLKKCPYIKSINLSGNDVSEDMLYSVRSLMGPSIHSGQSLERLTSLTLNDCPAVCDTFVQSLIKTRPTLHLLHLMACPNITDKVFLVDEKRQLIRDRARGNQSHLPLSVVTTSTVEVEYECKLGSVDISCCSQLTTAAVRHLVTLCGPTLQAVNISGTGADCCALLFLSGYSLSTAITISDEAECIPATLQNLQTSTKQQTESFDHLCEALMTMVGAPDNQGQVQPEPTTQNDLELHISQPEKQQGLTDENVANQETLQSASSTGSQEILDNVLDSNRNSTSRDTSQAQFVQTVNVSHTRDETMVCFDTSQSNVDCSADRPLECSADRPLDDNFVCNMCKNTDDSESATQTYVAGPCPSCQNSKPEQTELSGNTEQISSHPENTNTHEASRSPDSTEQVHFGTEDCVFNQDLLKSLSSTSVQLGDITLQDPSECTASVTQTNMQPFDGVSPYPLVYTPQLRSVEMSHIDFYSKTMGISCLRALLSNNRDLQQLRLSWRELSDEVMESIVADCHLVLRSVSLIDCLGLTSQGVATLCKKCPQLSALELLGVSFVGDSGIEPLLCTGNNHVTKLGLSETMITDNSLEKISQGCSKTLLHLYLSWCEEVTDDGINAVLLACTSLQKLVLRHCSVTGRTLHSIAATCTNLCHLHLSGVNTLTNTSLVAITLRLKQLKVLDISWNLEVTDVGMAAVLTHSTCLAHLMSNGIKQITTKPFWLLVSDMEALRRCKSALLLEKKMRSASTDFSPSDEEYEMLLPVRSSLYAPNLNKLELEWCDCASEAQLAEIALVCRGSLTITDYYGAEVKAGFVDRC